MKDNILTQPKVEFEISNFLPTWEFTRSLTIVLLREIDEENLRRSWPRPGLDSYAKHFEEMAVVQCAFNQAILSGEMDFSSVPNVNEFDGTLSKDKMRSALTDADSELTDILKKRNSICHQVNWDGVLLPLDQHMVSYINHETFHHGQFAMVCYQFGFDLPDIWKSTWTLP